MRCRNCESTLVQKVLDLGSAPPSNAYLNAKNLRGPETGYPLVIRVCHSCWLVQTEDFAAPDEIFDGDYAYFSAYSRSWLEHAKSFVDQAQRRLGTADGLGLWVDDEACHRAGSRPA